MWAMPADDDKYEFHVSPMANLLAGMMGNAYDPMLVLLASIIYNNSTDLIDRFGVPTDANTLSFFDIRIWLRPGITPEQLIERIRCAVGMDGTLIGSVWGRMRDKSERKPLSNRRDDLPVEVIERISRALNTDDHDIGVASNERERQAAGKEDTMPTTGDAEATGHGRQNGIPALPDYESKGLAISGVAGSSPNGEQAVAPVKRKGVTSQDELAKIEGTIPLLNKSGGLWVTTKEAAGIEDKTTQTLATYRQKGASLPSKMFGIDKGGRIWRRTGTRHARIWYLGSTLKPPNMPDGACLETH